MSIGGSRNNNGDINDENDSYMYDYGFEYGDGSGDGSGDHIDSSNNMNNNNNEGFEYDYDDNLTTITATASVSDFGDDIDMGNDQDDHHDQPGRAATSPQQHQLQSQPQPQPQPQLPVAIYHQSRKGGRYLGCCCDFRRAVLILACTSAMLSLLEILFYLLNLTTEDGNGNGNSNDDDIYHINNNATNDVKNLRIELEDLQDSYRFSYFILEVTTTVFSLVSVWGAWKFYQWAVTLGLIHALIAYAFVMYWDYELRMEWIETVTFADITVTVDTVDDEFNVDDVSTQSGSYIYFVIATTLSLIFFWCYPSSMFLYEVQKGILSKDTYIREEYCCCCLPTTTSTSTTVIRETSSRNWNGTRSNGTSIDMHR